MTKATYTTIANVEAYLIQTIDAGFQPDVQNWIAAVTAQIDDMANRKIVADTYGDEDFELRYFDVTSYGHLTIDDCVEIQKVEYKSGDSWVEVLAADYATYPALAPFRRITYTFPVGAQAVRIRAKWGYRATLPEDLMWAATVMVAGICTANQALANGSHGPVMKEKVGNYEVAYGANSQNEGRSGGLKDLELAKEIISKYRKILI